MNVTVRIVLFISPSNTGSKTDHTAHLRLISSMPSVVEGSTQLNLPGMVRIAREIRTP
jgi:hypothetical protein